MPCHKWVGARAPLGSMKFIVDGDAVVSVRASERTGNVQIAAVDLERECSEARHDLDCDEGRAQRGGSARIASWLRPTAVLYAANK